MDNLVVCQLVTLLSVVIRLSVVGLRVLEVLVVALKDSIGRCHLEVFLLSEVCDKTSRDIAILSIFCPTSGKNQTTRVYIKNELVFLYEIASVFQ